MAGPEQPEEHIPGICSSDVQDQNFKNSCFLATRELIPACLCLQRRSSEATIGVCFHYVQCCRHTHPDSSAEVVFEIRLFHAGLQALAVLVQEVRSQARQRLGAEGLLHLYRFVRNVVFAGKKKSFQVADYIPKASGRVPLRGGVAGTSYTDTKQHFVTGVQTTY